MDTLPGGRNYTAGGRGFDHRQEHAAVGVSARPTRPSRSDRIQIWRRITGVSIWARPSVLASGITALLACAVLSSCTTSIEGKSVPAQSSGEQPAGEPAKLPQPTDRDIQAVTVALRKLDACGVLDLTAAKAAGMPAGSTLLPTGPHSCMISPRPSYGPGDDGVEVSVGDGSNQFFRDLGAPTTLGGAKAYEYRDYSTTKRCELLVPVSFTRAIKFEYDSFHDIDTCRVLRPVAEASVAKLQQPDAITVEAAKWPGAGWDGCFMLAQALGQEAPNYTYKPAGLHDPFSGCETSKKTDKNSAPETVQTPKLEVAYDQVPNPPQQGRQVGGKTVEVRNYSHSCALIWNQGDSHTGNQWFAAQVVTVTAATCDIGAPLAEKAMQLFDQEPSDASAQPQRPLLYKPDENDNPGVGACADFGPLGTGPDCEPYHQTAVPHGTNKIMEAAATNRNVQCAVFIDAVKTLFGPTFGALTWGEHCFFVEPTHSLQLRVNVEKDNPPSDYGKKTDLWTDRQETTISGKPAVTFWGKDKKDFDIYLSPYNDLTRDGNVHIHVEAMPGRGDGARKELKLDPTKADIAKQVIAQITQKYFGG
jgi:hypothetical protein